MSVTTRTPDEIAIAKSGLVDPECTGVDEIIPAAFIA